MDLRVGDIVSRNSYHNDIYFKIIEISGDVALLKGVDLRLYADSTLDDLQKEVLKDDPIEQDRVIIEENRKTLNLDRSEYFYLPGKILHIDADIKLNNHSQTIVK